jgi:hypothetical protein
MHLSIRCNVIDRAVGFLSCIIGTGISSVGPKSATKTCPEPRASRLYAIITPSAPQNCEPGRENLPTWTPSLCCKRRVKAVVCQFKNRFRSAAESVFLSIPHPNHRKAALMRARKVSGEPRRSLLYRMIRLRPGGVVNRGIS